MKGLIDELEGLEARETSKSELLFWSPTPSKVTESHKKGMQLPHLSLAPRAHFLHVMSGRDTDMLVPSLGTAMTTGLSTQDILSPNACSASADSTNCV